MYNRRVESVLRQFRLQPNLLFPKFDLNRQEQNVATGPLHAGTELLELLAGRTIHKKGPSRATCERETPVLMNGISLPSFSRPRENWPYGQSVLLLNLFRECYTFTTLARPAP